MTPLIEILQHKLIKIFKKELKSTFKTINNNNNGNNNNNNNNEEEEINVLTVEILTNILIQCISNNFVASNFFVTASVAIKFGKTI
jgi:hypothetical protein